MRGTAEVGIERREFVFNPDPIDLQGQLIKGILGIEHFKE